MSEGKVDDPPEQAATQNGAAGSLQERMRKRSEELRSDRTEVFGIPGYDDIVAVELRTLSTETSLRIQNKNEKTKDLPMKVMYNWADQILAATVVLHQVNGEETKPWPDMTWIELARMSFENTQPDLTSRQALLLMMGNTLQTFMTEWITWSQEITPELNKEVGLDFVKTK